MPTEFTSPRFANPILTVREAANLVDMPKDTLQSWVGQRTGRPKVVTRIAPEKRGWPSIPLVGLAEASVLRALIEKNLPRREIYDVVTHLRERMDSPFPLADERLVTDGHMAFVLSDEETGWHVGSGQHIIVEAVKDYLQPIVFGEDHFPEAYRVPELPGVVIDPRFNSGRMAFERTRTPLFAVAGSLRSGEPAGEVAQGYGLTLDEVALVERRMDWVEQAA